MDTPQKTLEQISEESKDVRYLSLDTASRISGYTKDYLERLCRLHKVNCRVRGNGEFAIELGSLLKETHTILLSYEGISFLERGEFADMSAPSAHPPKEFSPATSLGKEADSLRSVDSVVAKEQVTTRPGPDFGEEHKTQRAVEPGVRFVGRPVVSGGPVPKALAVKREEVAAAPLDPWDAMLLGSSLKEAGAQAPSEDTRPSPYRPLKTSLDAAAHYDPAPLFPPLIPKKEQRTVFDPKDPKSLSTIFYAAPKSDISQAKTSFGLNDALASFPPPEYFPLKNLTFLASTKRSWTGSEAAPTSSALPLAATAPKASEVFAEKISAVPATPSDVRRTAGKLPELRVMPVPVLSASPPKTPVVLSALPEIAPPHALLSKEEHVPIVVEVHPLMKSAGFNIASLALLVGSALLLLGGTFPRGEFFASFFQQYIAGVAGVDPQNEAIEKEPDENALLFSDEVVVAPGRDPQTILVQPVFRDGAGSVHEFLFQSLNAPTQ